MNEFKFPTKYTEEVTKLIREDNILVPVSQIKAEANQKVTHNAPPPTVIELHRRLVNGTNQLFDVPKSIPAMIRSPYMQQAHGINDTCVFCKQKKCIDTNIFAQDSNSYSHKKSEDSCWTIILNVRCVWA